MKSVSQINFVSIGRFVKTHGYKGELSLKLNSELVKLPETELLFVEIDKIAVPFFIEKNGLKLRNQTYSIKFDTINTDDQAEELKNCPVLLPETYFKDEEFFDTLAFLDNFSVYDKNNFIGKVISVQRIPGNPLLEVQEEHGSIVLIPLNEHFIENIDEENSKIIFNLPEGLIEINRK